MAEQTAAGDSSTPTPSAASDSGQSLVLGTAGHIDHGKTSLVRALTGRDLDRLPEEKARGITIELGFAALELSEGLRVALIDVPGHEKFVRTMVAGASGLDLVMVVVAADEGVMPQTREHLAICELLGVHRGLVVLSKSDLVDEEMIELATEDVREAIAGGPLEGVPILPASAETGDGIDTVRATLEELIKTAPPREDDARPARLFIDRTFTKHGFGAVATGTWSGRPRKVGQSVVLEPGARKAKIRGLERHGAAVDFAESGARIAVNLQGVGTDEIHRGDLLAEPDALLETSTFDASIRWMARKAGLDQATSVELLTGTAERRARIAPIGEKPIGPGDRGFARIHVEGPALALLPGDRFVVRGFARDAGVGSTLGGGIVQDVMPPHRRRRDAGLRDDLERMTKGDAAAGLHVRILRSGLQGKLTRDLERETGLSAELLGNALDALMEAGEILRLDPTVSISNAAAERLMDELLAALDAYHAGNPLQPGIPRATLAGSLPTNVTSEAASFLLSRLVEREAITIARETVARTGFTSTLNEAQTQLAEDLKRRFADAALDAPALRTIAETSGESVDALRAIAHYLEREKILVAAPDELFFDRASVATLIESVLGHFAQSDELDTQTLKTMIGTSRRTAMPLMALLDELQVTRRDGSLRRLLNREPRW
ncbi:MAG: selenocysteine-specific translation elongation factor [Myxococcota bacterium]